MPLSGLFKMLELQKSVYLLHSLIREKGMIDGVLGGIEYNDYDLWDLTGYRPELAGSPEKFFRVLDKIKDPEMQEMAVRGVSETCSKLGDTIWLFHL